MIRRLFSKPEEEEQHYKRKHIKKVHKYIKKMSKRGHSSDSIYEALNKAGFPKDFIQLVMKEADLFFAPKPKDIKINRLETKQAKKKTIKEIKRGEIMSKGINQEQARHLLRDVEPEKSFWLNCGPILRNLEGFSGVLENLDDERFGYHVNAEKNDFAKWIEEVVEDKKLAKEILKTKTRASMLKAVRSRISLLKKAAV